MPAVLPLCEVLVTAVPWQAVRRARTQDGPMLLKLCREAPKSDCLIYPFEEILLLSLCFGWENVARLVKG